jgi:hypothetical protein
MAASPSPAGNTTTPAFGARPKWGDVLARGAGGGSGHLDRAFVEERNATPACRSPRPSRKEPTELEGSRKKPKHPEAPNRNSVGNSKYHHIALGSSANQTASRAPEAKGVPVLSASQAQVLWL